MYSMFVGLKSPILVPFHRCIVCLFLLYSTGCEMVAMKPQIKPQILPKAHRNNVGWFCDDGADCSCCCCVKPNTSNSWPNTNGTLGPRVPQAGSSPNSPFLQFHCHRYQHPPAASSPIPAAPAHRNYTHLPQD
jgi:hypothetical protein